MNAILSNWNFMRVFRLLLGIAIIVQAAMASEIAMLFVGIAFTAMPVFNIGCCATGACSVPQKKQSVSPEKVTYEEVV